MVIAGAAAVAATDQTIPNWGRWTLAGTALASASVLGIAVLIGPVARRLAGDRRPLTQAERQQMTATERLEAVNAARHTLIQAATGLVVIGGVVFTAQGLWYTAQSLDASQQAQRTAEQGQITDRYTKAVEQLGSTKMDVRLGGMYALERLAKDSPRDHQTVYDVLAAFVREHDPKPSTRSEDLPRMPATDMQAAMTIIGRRDTTQDVRAPSLFLIRIPGTDLSGANLSGAELSASELSGTNLARANLIDTHLNGTDLSFAFLHGARLTRAHLNGAVLTNAHLTNVDLTGADLSNAVLTGADLTGTDLTGANLTGTDLTGANLTGANLTDVELRSANLNGADLRSANLTGADLTGADLRTVRGVTENKIRKVAHVDTTTKF
ncbi:pentapeptide repeat-containing protein [Nonomuraea aridisoli]|uniref:pentapeptide repeat-containing protein n=1 Tax=Nonomuraea aridisoli TaxID=2070368 RepID=UPI0015E89C00|nr:pentapeptide repeat-containing protein [Nonomuraea aridisoli]